MNFKPQFAALSRLEKRYRRGEFSLRETIDILRHRLLRTIRAYKKKAK
jgi:hypothetical protein